MISRPLTEAEAAEFLGIGARTLRELRREGRIRYVALTARIIAEVLDLHEKDVLAAQSRFRALGLTQTGPLFSEDDGKLCGRGTWLNKRGVHVQDEMPEHLWRWP